MASKNENNASVPTSASNTPIALDDDESPVETNSDPSILPITSRHSSAVWSDFKRKRVGDVEKAECNHCSKLLASGSKAGTTHLKDHLKICPKRVGRISDLLRRLVDEYGFKIGKTQGRSSQQPFDSGSSSSKANEETYMQEFAEFLQQDKDPSHEISELDK
uniref:BED-type domain-containing protein n=1 Tax=Chenopodium quinoa TaxID=63459 RepID=A0A803LVV7_CHEQI